MIVGIDLRCLPADGSEGAGVAHAARFLMDALFVRDVPWDWRLYLPIGASAGVETRQMVRLDDVSGSTLRKTLRSRSCDILFVPSGAVAPRMRVPTMPWVHDLAIYAHPEWFPQSPTRRWLTTRLFRRGVTSAPTVFAVSEDTKREIVRLFGVDPERIHVTQEGGDPVLASLQGEALMTAKHVARHRLADVGLICPYILALGTVEPRKNLVTLIDAWTASRDTFASSTDLVIAGRNGWRHDDVQAAIRSVASAGGDGGRIRRIERVEDAFRRDLLLGATVVALPSWHEGFGLVALEAMQAETPVIASRAGAIPEVVGGAGLLLDPRDVQGWGDAFVRVMADDVLRMRMALEGKTRSHDLTWQRTASIVVDALRTII
ncbi:glycosyltransferase family 4 protein [Patescibacteria group bacterium]|nr:glycosyltransferase family 4 protein [Patescibacteria group bacterium]MBU1448365.1 glycosyltransferase family 4 protein [Patescibacteria group bacterium]MBU2613446.1 glycosyltransferase family 4 protein [Patescibacteria group bacterium]